MPRPSFRILRFLALPQLHRVPAQYLKQTLPLLVPQPRHRNGSGCEPGVADHIGGRQSVQEERQRQRGETYQELRAALNGSLFGIRRRREQLLLHHVLRRKQCRR